MPMRLHDILSCAAGGLMLLAVPALTACSSGASQRAMLRVLDESTGAPVGQARIEVLAKEFFLPVDPFPTIDPADHKPVRAQTDSDGRAAIQLPDDLPARLTIDAAGYERLQGVIEPIRRRGGSAAAPHWWLSGVTHTPPVGATGPLGRLSVEILPP